MNDLFKFKKVLVTLLFYGLLIFCESNSVFGQVTLMDEIKISNQALFFDGSKVPESQRLTFPNRPKYDYAFGSRITPHGDCIYKYKEFVFMTWYKGGESNRHVMLTRYNTNTKTQVTIQFPHKHTGFQNRPHIGESHNTIAVGVAPIDGTVHLLYDMHAYSKKRPANGSLKNDYFRYRYSRDNVATLPDSQFTLDKFFPKRLYLKSGDNYERLTYPTFFNNEAGELFVSMREGGNNNGKYMTAKYNGNSWSSFKDFNVLNAKSKGNGYNWGLYGDFKFINGKMHIGFHTRKKISTDKFELNNGFYYAYAENSNNLTNWKDHKGGNVSIPVKNPEKIFISEPGNAVSGSGRNSVRISSSADWTVTKNGSIHFRARVKGTNGTKNVHTYKKAGENNFRTSTNFPGGDFHSIGNDVYLVGLESGRPVIYKAKGGTNSWNKIYSTSFGKRFRHGVVHIKDGILYYYLMEKKSGSAQPIYLQMIDLDVETDSGPNTPPSVSFATPSGNTSVQEGYNEFEVTVNASDSDGSVSNVKLYVDGNLIRQESAAPYTWGIGNNADELLGLSAGQHTFKAEATDNDGAKTSKTFVLTVNGTSNNQDPNVSFALPSSNLTVNEGYDLTVVVNANDPDGSVSNVKLYINNNLVRQENGAPYEWGHNNSPNPNEVNGLSAGTYIIKAVATDNEGKTGEAKLTLTVQGDNDGGDGDGNNTGGCSFGAPMNSGLNAMDKVTYSNVSVLGDDGPKLGNFRRFTINWAPQNNGLYQFAINTNNGSPDWYVDFKETMSFQLQNSSPEITLNNTGFAGLDGSYWVAMDGANFVMVSKNKNFTLYFNNSSSSPDCNRAQPDIDISQIRMFPNPVFDSQLTVSGLSNDLKAMEIISIDGRVVQKVSTKNETATIDVSELPTGSYFLSIKSTRFKESLLFVKK